MKTGFNAMGMPVPVNRLHAGYKTVKEILDCDNELAWSIANRCKYYIEKDKCAYIIGMVSLEDILKKELFTSNKGYADAVLASIDLTGRYRLLAVMLTD